MHGLSAFLRRLRCFLSPDAIRYVADTAGSSLAVAVLELFYSALAAFTLVSDEISSATRFDYFSKLEFNVPSGVCTHRHEHLP